MTKDTKDKIFELISKHKDGLSITETVDKSEYSRSTVRTAIAFLLGERKIKERKIGMAKLYTENDKKNKK